MRRAAIACAAAVAGLAAAPAVAGAALITFGSSLATPADTSEPRGADTIFFQSAFPDGRATTVPASGQIRSFRIKGWAPNQPAAFPPGGGRRCFTSRRCGRSATARTRCS